MVVRCKSQQVPVGPPHTQHRGQHPPTAVFTLDGPRVGSRAPLCVLVLNLIPVLSGGRLKLVCAQGTERVPAHTPLPGHRVPRQTPLCLD